MDLSRVTCTICKRDFNTVKGLKIHTGKMHKDFQPVMSSDGQSQHASSATCDICNATFSDTCALDDHKRTVHNTQSVQHVNVSTSSSVDHGSSSNDSMQTLSDMMLTRKHEVLVNCTVCNKVCKNRSALRMHNLKCHTLPVASASATVDAASECSSMHYENTVVSMTTSNQQNTDTQQQSSNNPDTEQQSSDNSGAQQETVIKCTLCGKICKTVKGLLLHNIQAHRVSALGTTTDAQQETLSTCTLCNKVCKTPAGLRVHQIQVHGLPTTGSSTTSCTVDTSVQCEETVESMSTCSQGQSSQNTDAQQETVIKCRLCDKIFKTVASLQMHTVRVHRDPTPGTSTTWCTVGASVHCEETVGVTTRSRVQSSQNTGPQQQSSHNTGAQQEEQSSGEARSWSSPTSRRLKPTLKRKMEAQLMEFQRQFSHVNRDHTSALNESHRKLKQYHDSMLERVQNTATEKLSKEVQDVVEDLSLIHI